MRTPSIPALALALLLFTIASASCDEPEEGDPVDAGRVDASGLDASEPDASGLDAGATDGESPPDPHCSTASVSWRLRSSATTTIASSADVALAQEYAAAIEREAADLEAALAATGCLGRAGIERVRALISLGDTAGCLEVALSCIEGQATLSGAQAAVAFYGAQCAEGEGRYALALELLDRSTDPAIADECGERTGRVFWYASFAIARGYSDRVDAIFARAPSLDMASAGSAIAYWVGSGGTFEALRSFVAASFQGSDRLLDEIAISMWYDVLYRASLDLEIRAFIADNREAIERSRTVFSTLPYLYLSFYSSSNGIDFSLADRVYQPYAQAAAFTSWLPSEFNVYTYTEQFESVCTDGLLQGADRQSYDDLVGGWKSGLISDAAALSEAEALLAESGDAADLLTFMGTLLERSGAEEEALDHFFRAHRACVYYNRSHWALQETRLWSEIRQRDDFQERLTERTEVIADLGEVPALASYTTNFASLSRDQVDGLKYALRFWVPYLEALVATGSSIYVKHSFELLSSVPGLEIIRDARIEYPGDYRLWDDVRGAGGNPVAVDVNEMMFNPYGEYNLAAHEISHQVEGIAPANLALCLTALYEAALARDLFVNYYSSINQSEYFAEGVVTYLIPPDAPPYFGRNRGWLVDNDPDLLDLVEQLSLGTPLDAVLCPI